MAKRSLMFVGAIASSALVLAACSSSSSSSTAPAASDTAAASSAPAAAGGKVGVILPDSASSARWETADRKFLEEAFKAAGVEYDIQNAGGDKAKFVTIGDQLLAGGAKVLVIVGLDSDSAGAVIKKAKAQNVPVVDYDRLNLGGGSNYYVSFDNVAVGTKIGEGLVKCMNDNGKTSGNVALLNGSPTDNNATLFKQGYEKVIKDAGFTVTKDQAVPDWDNAKGAVLFEQMFTEAKGDFVGVAAANDGLGGAAISVLAKNGQSGKIPVTGQDATDEGLQRVLQGTQCMTVYKAIKAQAAAAAQIGVALAKGDKAAADALATGKTMDSVTKADVPSVLLIPVGITKATVKDVLADGFTTYDKVCATDELKKLCEANGIMK